MIINNKIIFNNSLGDITALDLNTGNLSWHTPTQKKAIYEDALFLKNADLVVGKNSIFLSNNTNDFFSIAADTGIINWRQKINSELTPTFISNLLFWWRNFKRIFTCNDTWCSFWNLFFNLYC